MKNLVLIGIMGCGKTTVGRIISKRFKMNFIDMDEQLEKEHGPISALFEQGEDYFRELESALVYRLSQCDNHIISTGGGVVKRPENMIHLKKNGLIVFIDRPLEQILNDIDISKRPLLKDGTAKLSAIYEERYPIYKSVCDVRIDASKGLHKTISQLRAAWKQEKAMRIK